MQLDIAAINNIARQIAGEEQSARSQRIKDWQRRRSQDGLVKGGELPHYFNMGKAINAQQSDMFLAKMQVARMYSDMTVGQTYHQSEVEMAIENEWTDIIAIYEDNHMKNMRIPTFIRNMLLDIRAAKTLFAVLYENFGDNIPNIVNLIISDFLSYNKDIQSNSELHNLFLDFYYTINGYRADSLCCVAPIDKDSADALILFLPKYGKLNFSDIKAGTFKAMSILYDSQIDPDVTMESLYNMFTILYGRDKLKLAAVALLLESSSRKFNKLSAEKKTLWHKLTTLALDIIETDYQNVNHNIGTLYMNELRRQNGEKRISLKEIDANRYPNIVRAVDYSLGKDGRLGQLV